MARDDEHDASRFTSAIVWGYWDNLLGKPLTDDDFVRLDHLVVSSGWIPAPL